MAEIPNIKTPVFHLFEIDKSAPDVTVGRIESCIIHVDNIYTDELTDAVTCDKSVDTVGTIKITVPRFEQRIGDRYDETYRDAYSDLVPNEKWLKIIRDQITGETNYFVTTVKGRRPIDLQTYYTEDDFQKVGIGDTSRPTIDEGGLMESGAERRFNGFTPHFHGWLTSVDVSSDGLSWILGFTDIIQMMKSHHVTDYANEPAEITGKHVTKNIVTIASSTTSSLFEKLDLVWRGALAVTTPKNGYSMYNRISCDDEDQLDPESWGWDTIKKYSMDKVYGMHHDFFARSYDLLLRRIDESWSIDELGANTFNVMSNIFEAYNIPVTYDIMLTRIDESEGYGRYYIQPDFFPANAEVNIERTLFDAEFTYNLHGGYLNMYNVYDPNDVNDPNADKTSPDFVDATWGCGRARVAANTSRTTSIDPYPIIGQGTLTTDVESFPTDFEANEACRTVARGELKKSVSNRMTFIYQPSEDLDTDTQVYVLGDTVNIKVLDLNLTSKYTVTGVTLTLDPTEGREIWDYTGSQSYGELEIE